MKNNKKRKWLILLITSILAASFVVLQDLAFLGVDTTFNIFSPEILYIMSEFKLLLYIAVTVLLFIFLIMMIYRASVKLIEINRLRHRML